MRITYQDLQRKSGKELRRRASVEGYRYKDINKIGRKEWGRILRRLAEGKTNKTELCERYCVTLPELKRYINWILESPL